MKIAKASMVLLLLLVLAAGGVLANKGRKLPADAYIKTAKIEVIEAKGDTNRINTAIAMLDSLIMHYGPRPEAYYWMSKIMIDKTNLQPTPDKKLVFLNQLVAYIDSLDMTCADKKLNKKLREKCDDWTTEIDTARYVIWGDFYNDGIERLNGLEDLKKSMSGESDSTTLAEMQSDVEALADTTRLMFRLAITVDSTDDRGLRAMASVFEKTGNYDSAITYLEKAIPFVDNRLDMWTAIAYDYTQKNDYSGAIKWFQMFVDTALATPGVLDDESNRATVVSIMENLSICENNVKNYEEAFANYRRLLGIDPNNMDALVGVGRYFRQMAITASDSANAYQKATNEAKVAEWRQTRDNLFDSAIVSMQKAVDIRSADPDVENNQSVRREYIGQLDELSLLLVIRGRYEEGLQHFLKLVELDPNNTGAWTSVGDCRINLADYKGAAEAYEKVIAIDPTNKQVLERLVDLYSAPEARNEKRKAEIDKMLKKL